MADEDKYLGIGELHKKLVGEMEFRQSVLNMWVSTEESQPIYILASNHRVASYIFNHYFLYTNLIPSTRFFHYIWSCDRLRGIRNRYIIISNERYPDSSFYDRLSWIRDFGGAMGLELIYEQDLEKEQVRQKVSRQRPKTSESQ